MTHSLSQSQSNVSHAPDFTALDSMFQDIAQVLLKYGETCKGNAPEEKAQGFDTEQMAVPRSGSSKRTIRKEKYHALAYNHNDTTAFSDKELAKSFEETYLSGNFRDEIRYYFVPANRVRYEYKLLCQQQQKNIFDLLSSVYDELELKSKLIACKDKDSKLQHLTLSQLRESILHSLKLFHIIDIHLNSFRLVHKTMLPLRNKG